MMENQLCPSASALLIILFVLTAFLQVVRLIRLLRANYTLAGANETLPFSCLPSSRSALRELLIITLMDAILIKYLPKGFQDVCASENDHMMKAALMSGDG